MKRYFKNLEKDETLTLLGFGVVPGDRISGTTQRFPELFSLCLPWFVRSAVLSAAGMNEKKNVVS